MRSVPAPQRAQRSYKGAQEHEGFFAEDTEVADVFAPPREDFLAGGTPSYMRAP